MISGGLCAASTCHKASPSFPAHNNRKGRGIATLGLLHVVARSHPNMQFAPFSKTGVAHATARSSLESHDLSALDCAIIRRRDGHHHQHRDYDICNRTPLPHKIGFAKKGLC